MASSGKCILLVEDSDDDVLFFKRALRLAEMANPVIRVSNGEQAIAYFKGEGEYSDREAFPMPFAVMLDLRLPGVNGLEVLRWIRSQPALSSILVIVLSGSALPSAAGNSYEAGANRYLNKPCKADDLRNLATQFPGPWEKALGN